MTGCILYHTGNEQTGKIILCMCYLLAHSTPNSPPPTPTLFTLWRLENKTQILNLCCWSWPTKHGLEFQRRAPFQNREASTLKDLWLLLLSFFFAWNADAMSWENAAILCLVVQSEAHTKNCRVRERTWFLADSLIWSSLDSSLPVTSSLAFPVTLRSVTIQELTSYLLYIIAPLCQTSSVLPFKNHCLCLFKCYCWML